MAMPSEMHATAHQEGGMNAQAGMAMPTDMPCCPDKAPDCAKDCPLMALCMVGTPQAAPHAPALFVPLTIASILIPSNEINLSGLTQDPPPRPPKA
jgi:hypothetical protein